MQKFLLVLVFVASIIVYTNAQVKVYSGGGVSIGSTTAPPSGFKLQLIGNSVFSASTSSITSSAYIRGLNGYSTATTPDYTWYNNDQVGIFHPSGDNIGFTVAGSEKMRINSSGYIGIGDNSPASLLTVGNGDLFQVNSSGYVQSVSGSASNPTYSFTGTTNTGMFSSASSILNFTTGGTERMRINSSGDIGIGASTASNYRLYANGGLFRFLCTSHSSIEFNLWNNLPRIESPQNTIIFFNTSAGDYINIHVKTCTEFSDRSAKKNITSISSGLSKVLQLQGVTFNWLNDSANSKLSSGFIAQDVELIIPEVVVKVDSNQKMLLHYTGIIPYLVEAIKEQNKQITQLQNDLNNCCTTQKGSGNDKGGNINQNNSNPDSPILYQNTPNPFNAKTEINYYLPNNISKASILVFDMQGALLKTYTLTSRGNGSLEIFGNELKPGMYMYSLIVDDKEIDTKKMILTN